MTPLSSPAGGTLALLVTAPYVRCVCPEGQNVTLSCRVSGPLADRHDLLYKTWYFSSTGDQSCSEKQHIRNLTERELHHEPGQHHGTAPNGTGRSTHGWQGSHRGVEFVPNHHGAFHIVVMNLTLQDSGNYCCYAMEVRREHGKPQTLQAAHGFVELQIQRGERGDEGGVMGCQRGLGVPEGHQGTGHEHLVVALPGHRDVVALSPTPHGEQQMWKGRMMA